MILFAGSVNTISFSRSSITLIAACEDSANEVTNILKATRKDTKRVCIS